MGYGALKTYCFDMDGVICDIDDDCYSKRSPNRKTIKLMSILVKRGDLVIIHTGRHINNLIVTKKWLSKYKVNYHHLQFGKPVADVYIDDKGVRFKKWTRETIEYFR